MQRRRILALDGGGIRGLFSIEVLVRMEELLRAHYGGDEKFRLRDHFEFIAGTSTGAIIASFLSWGESAVRVREMYLARARAMFKKSPLWLWHVAKYRHEELSAFLKGYFCEDDGTPALLGTDKLAGRTLMLVLRNASRGSAWPVTNNPRAQFNQRVDSNGKEIASCNLNLPLWQLVRASTAAPWFFPPESITLGERERYVFIDGGITPYNNPALIAALTAMLPCYRMDWPMGVDKIRLVSVGTGRVRSLLSPRLNALVTRLSHALMVPRGLMETISLEQDMLCRVLGRCEFGDMIDLEVGNLIDDMTVVPPMLKSILAPEESKFAYIRYNKLFTAEEIADAEKIGGRFNLDNLSLVAYIQEAGRSYASKNVVLQHLL